MTATEAVQLCVCQRFISDRIAATLFVSRQATKRGGSIRTALSQPQLSEQLLSDLAEVWEEDSKTVLTKLAVSDPGKLATIAYGLLPRDVFVQVQANGPSGRTIQHVISLLTLKSSPVTLGRAAVKPFSP